ncbi:hypothetical protein D5125_17265 [Magnetovirga frankeli]|nr:hypothetical protein D5125_17265 [gamma proteobacterium SS-5]
MTPRHATAFDPLQQLAGRFIAGVLGHQLALHRQLQDQLAEFLDAVGSVEEWAELVEELGLGHGLSLPA